MEQAHMTMPADAQMVEWCEQHVHYYQRLKEKKEPLDDWEFEDEHELSMLKAILALLRSLDAVELPSEPHFVEQMRQWPDNEIYQSHTAIVYIDALRTAAESLALKLKDAEQQDEETRKLLSVERKRVKELEDALNQIAAWHDGETVGSHFDEPGSAEIARAALKGGGGVSHV